MLPHGIHCSKLKCNIFSRYSNNL
uniref:Uncharacterized protein n=1 Tax=Anguilla anguilla TaxID=7936 RepID=A0A0E9UUW2_ANGAN